MSPAPWGETSHLAAAVIVTRAHGCQTAAGHCYVMLGTIKFVDKRANENSARRLDHCDVTALRSGFGVPTGVPHSEVELQTELKSFTTAHLGSNTNQYIGRIYNGIVIQYWRSCTPSRSIGECAVPGLNAILCFLWFTNCVLLFDKNLLLGCLWHLVFV